MPKGLAVVARGVFFFFFLLGGDTSSTVAVATVSPCVSLALLLRKVR